MQRDVWGQCDSMVQHPLPWSWAPPRAWGVPGKLFVFPPVGHCTLGAWPVHLSLLGSLPNPIRDALEILKRYFRDPKEML